MTNRFKAVGVMAAFIALSLAFIPIIKIFVESLPFEKEQLDAIKKFLGYLYAFLFFGALLLWLKLIQKTKK